jgi:acetyl-CoA carboxylase biotin carboxyl carrier protein
MADPKPTAPSEGAMRVDTDLIRELAELLSANALTEIEVEDGDRKIKVRRDSAPAGASLTPAQIAAFGMLRDSTGQAPAAGPAKELESPPADTGNAVKSPMVGTAFLSPEPGAKPFVSVGDAV